MSDDEDFVRELRERVDAALPRIDVETAVVVPRALRRRSVARSVGTLTAMVLLGAAAWGAGSVWSPRTTTPPVGMATTSPVAAPASSYDAAQRAGLFGMWRVSAVGEGPDTWLRLDGSERGLLWRDCGVLDVSWAVGPSAFVSHVYGWSGTCGDGTAVPGAPWLDAATAYRADGDGWQLLGADGAVVATLRQDGAPAPRSDVAPELSEPPVVDDAVRHWVSEPAPVPDGLVAATRDQVASRWVQAGSPATLPYVELSADGGWTGSDGCNEASGRWAMDAGGRLLVVGGATAAMGCDGAPLPDLLVTARRAAISGGSLVLLDDEGQTVATLTRAAGEPPLVTAVPASPPGVADHASLSCMADGFFTSGLPVAASGDGVRLEVGGVGSAPPPGTELHVGWSGGGEYVAAVPDAPTEWVVPVPPGTAQVWCSNPAVPDDSSPWPKVTLTVVDPFGYWAPSSLAAKHCTPGAEADVPVPAGARDRAIPSDAVTALAASLGIDGSRVEPVSVGYADQHTTTWLIYDGATPYMAATVTGDLGSFSAAGDVMCARP